MAVVVLLAFAVLMSVGIAAVVMYAFKLQREGQAAAPEEDADDGAVHRAVSAQHASAAASYICLCLRYAAHGRC